MNIVVGKASADAGYKEVMHRLSLPSSQHLAPPYQNVGDSSSDTPRQWRRKARKAVGMPASEDVGILAGVLSALRSQVEEHTGLAVTVASVTTPHLIALYNEDLMDAFESVGLQYLAFPVQYYASYFYETSTAYAGYGYGLCSDYTDKEGCKREQDACDSEVVMAVLFTRSVLTVSLSIMKSAYYLYEPAPGKYEMDFDVGYDARYSFDTDDEYWRTVDSRLGQILRDNHHYARPTKVLLMGDCVEVEGFRDVLRNVLDEQTSTRPEIFSAGAEGVAARGTAELVKRAVYVADTILLLMR